MQIVEWAMKLRHLPLLLSLPLLAQESRMDEAFFSGDLRAILAGCASTASFLQPQDAKVLADVGCAYLLSGKTQRGEESLRFAEMQSPNDGEVLRLIGLAYLKAGRRKDALQAYEKILLRDARSKRDIAAAALDLTNQGFIQDGERFMNAYLIQDNGDWERFIEFGKALLKGGSKKRAAAWFSRATFIKPKEEKVYQYIIRAYAENRAIK